MTTAQPTRERHLGRRHAHPADGLHEKVEPFVGREDRAGTTRRSPGVRESRVEATRPPGLYGLFLDRNRHGNVAQEAIMLKGASGGPLVIGIVFITQRETRLIGILGFLAAAALAGWEWHRRNRAEKA
jgi:hypothetical protein